MFFANVYRKISHPPKLIGIELIIYIIYNQEKENENEKAKGEFRLWKFFQFFKNFFKENENLEKKKNSGQIMLKNVLYSNSCFRERIFKIHI